MNKNPKRILWITNNWLSDFGGRKIVSKKILKFLAHKKFSITILDFEEHPPSKKDLKQYIQLPKTIAFRSSVIQNNKEVIFKLLRYPNKNNLDIIICSTYALIDILSIFTIRLFNLLPHTKIVLFENGNPLQDIRLSRFWHLYALMGKFFYPAFDFIITPGVSLRQMFINQFGVTANKIYTIPQPIVSKQTSRLTSEPLSNKLFQQKKSKIIITSSRLILPSKDFPTLFKAIKIVLNKVDAVLAILGTGPHRRKIEALAKRLKLENRIFFLGFRKNPFKYLAKSDVFVLSSLHEGAPLVLVEAMACRIPVVASDCDFGPRDILENGKNGILVPIGDQYSMAEAIIKLLNNEKLRQEFIAKGKVKSQHYLEEKSLKAWYDFLQSLNYDKA